MKENVTTKKAPVKKTSVKKTAVEPFAETVEPARVSSPHVSKGQRVAKSTPAAETKPPKKTVVKKAKKVAVDPFAEIAVTEKIAAEPVKKTAKKLVSKKSEPEQVATGAVKKKRVVKTKPATLDVTPELAATEPAVELSPVFKALADVKLPELERENRARLSMQSPTRLYFYWSLKENPWHQLRAIFGDDLGAYTLVVKLVNLTRDTEEIHPCEPQGNWWFAAEPGTEYQAEIGFYATNRPYFRVLYSNTIATPLRTPSPHSADESQWTVTATKFAEVLDVSGFSRDALDVAIAGDDVYGADKAAHIAFSRLLGTGEYALRTIAAGDIRYAMAALARGTVLEELRWQIDDRLFAILQANTEKLTSASAQSAITEYFDIDEAEFDVEQTGPTVFGASLVNFPRNLKSRRPTRYNPLSSSSIR